MKARFHKYQAMGNDMIVIDPGQCEVALIPENIRLICDRHFGVGADGICYGPLPGQPHPYTMRFFNPDGSEAEKSGNGLRIFARYLWDQGIACQRDFLVAIGDEQIAVRVHDENAHAISLGMGKLLFPFVGEEMLLAGEPIKVTAVSLGNPHAVIFTDNLEQIHTLGPLVETATAFPERANVQLVRVVDTHHIQIEIWERGAGYTLASGTSCSAAAGAAVRAGHCRSPVEVRMAGGTGRVMIDADWRVELWGTVSAVYQASFDLEMQRTFEDNQKRMASSTRISCDRHP